MNTADSADPAINPPILAISKMPEKEPYLERGTMSATLASMRGSEMVLPIDASRTNSMRISYDSEKLRGIVETAEINIPIPTKEVFPTRSLTFPSGI